MQQLDPRPRVAALTVVLDGDLGRDPAKGVWAAEKTKTKHYRLKTKD